MGDRALISRLQSIFSLEIRGLDCLTEKIEVEYTIKHDYLEVTNIRIGITSTNFRGQKLPVVEIALQYTRKCPLQLENQN